MHRYTTPSGLDRHIYVWWEGRLTERLEPSAIQLKKTSLSVGSPMSEHLLRSLVESQQGTYRTWLETAQRLLVRHEIVGRGRLAAQGPIERPLMSSGSKIDDVLYLLLQLDRREANLELAIELGQAKSAIWGKPEDRLCLAAFFVVAAELKRRTPGQQSLVWSLLRTAVQIFQELKEERKTLSDAKLMPTYLYWYTRALDEGLGEPDAALAVMHEQAPEHLAPPEVLDRLVEITRKAISSDAATKVKKSLSVLDAIKGTDTSPPRIGRHKEDLDRLLRAQGDPAAGGITLRGER